MASEAHYLIAYGMFKAEYHAYRYDHHRQSDGNTGRSDADYRLRHLAFVAVVGVNTPCNE